MKYLHFFSCPKCDQVSRFSDSKKVSDDSTFESTCTDHGRQDFQFYKTKEAM